jgi:glutamine synthetase
VKTLPLNLLDALRALEGSAVLKDKLGAFVPAYLKMKHQEWNAYSGHLTQWERDNTLDC